MLKRYKRKERVFYLVPGRAHSFSSMGEQGVGMRKRRSLHTANGEKRERGNRDHEVSWWEELCSVGSSAPEGSVKLEERKWPAVGMCQRRFQGEGGFELSLEEQRDLVRLRSVGG